ncbi:MAG: dethiobiotin synthase [Proteobacteria bacterium]|nr:dethiobiotin synthase [Pseudomonadota bacterium]MBU1641401.1 dethiobiotin synthase [Pseudomonadota bacterium]
MSSWPAKIMITGTDTSVGKTFVTALLLDYLKNKGVDVGYLKLVSCGGERSEDCLYCEEKSGVQGEVVYHFNLAASPHLAARQQGERVDPALLSATIAQKNCYDVLVVEGAGGLCVPLNDETLLIDFMQAHPLPTILVARSGLGTLNHTLLSVEALRVRNIPLLGIIFSDEKNYDQEDILVLDNMATIARLTGLPVLGRLPRCVDFDEARRCFVKIGAALLAS